MMPNDAVLVPSSEHGARSSLGICTPLGLCAHDEHRMVIATRSFLLRRCGVCMATMAMLADAPSTSWPVVYVTSDDMGHLQQGSVTRGECWPELFAVADIPSTHC